MSSWKHTRRKNGTYVFKHNGDTIYTADKICVMYDSETYLMLKHGHAANIMTHAAIKKQALRKLGTEGGNKMADCIKVIELHDNISLDRLYKVLNVPGVLENYVKANESSIISAEIRESAK